MDSRELNQYLGSAVFEVLPNIQAQMKGPDVNLKVEIREEAAYLSYENIKGAGGLPVGTAGRGMLMLSGGIDSPVAGYLALKRGVDIEAVHFASPPYTSPGALKKAQDLTRKLTKFGGNIDFIEVPFVQLSQWINWKSLISLKELILSIFQFNHLKIAVLSLRQIVQKQIQKSKMLNNTKNAWMLKDLLNVLWQELK